MPTIRINDELWEKLREFEVLETNIAGQAVDRKEITERQLEKYMTDNKKELEKINKKLKS